MKNNQIDWKLRILVKAIPKNEKKNLEQGNKMHKEYKNPYWWIEQDNKTTAVKSNHEKIIY